MTYNSRKMKDIFNNCRSGAITKEAKFRPRSAIKKAALSKKEQAKAGKGKKKTRYSKQSKKKQEKARKR